MSPRRNRWTAPLLLSAVAFTAAAIAAPTATPGKAPPLQQLSGTYRSTAAEDWGRGSFGSREFGFENGRWSLRFVLALDPALQRPVFEFRTLGSYRVGRPSKAVPGAHEALFLEDRKFVTLRTADPALIAAFGLADCGLTPDVEKDISESGCALWKPVAQCREDHDLLALNADGGLRLGVRPMDNDLCTADKRPKALLPPVRKVA